jgi:hypothetical protein
MNFIENLTFHHVPKSVSVRLTDLTFHPAPSHWEFCESKIPRVELSMAMVSHGWVRWDLSQLEWILTYINRYWNHYQPLLSSYAKSSSDSSVRWDLSQLSHAKSESLPEDINGWRCWRLSTVTRRWNPHVSGIFQLKRHRLAAMGLELQHMLPKWKVSLNQDHKSQQKHD